MFSLLPTAYRGVAELGLISGVGMFIALFANLTVLPAILSLAPEALFRYFLHSIKKASRTPRRSDDARVNSRPLAGANWVPFGSMARPPGVRLLQQPSAPAKKLEPVSPAGKAGVLSRFMGRMDFFDIANRYAGLDSLRGFEVKARITREGRFHPESCRLIC